MKLLTFIFLAILTLDGFAQTDTKTDQIHLRDLSIINGKVIEVDDEVIKYKKKESNDIFEIELAEVSHILYASGKLQNFKLQEVSKISNRKKTRELKNTQKPQETILQAEISKESTKPIEENTALSKVEVKETEPNAKTEEQAEVVKKEVEVVPEVVKVVKKETQINTPMKYADDKPKKTLPLILGVSSLGSLAYALSLNAGWKSKINNVNTTLSKGLTQEYATAYSNAEKYQSKEKIRNVLMGAGGLLAILDVAIIVKNKSKKNRVSFKSTGIIYSYKF